MRRRWIAVGLSAIGLSTALLIAQTPAPKPIPAKAGSPERTSDVEVVGHIVKLPELPPPELSAIKVPEGFMVERFASELGNARVLAVSPAGNVYVSRRQQADILMLKVGANGSAEGPPVRVAARPGMHGICFHGDKVYLVAVHELYRADVKADGTFGELEMLVNDLPDAGQHHNRMVQFGPDGMLYVSCGSTCNEANEPNPENATVLQIAPDGKTRSIFAAGLRNTIGFGWHPKTGDLWGMDHGIDWLGDDLPPEELNLIRKDRHYGWPYFYGDNQANPHTDPPAGLEKSEWNSVSVPITLGYTAHSAPMQLAFYGGTQFPAEYQGDAFVAMRGSWNRKPPSGYEVVRVKFDGGKPVGFQKFVTGFVTPQGQHARPCGCAVAKDGSLLFTDDRNGVIYRVSYAGPAKPGAAMIVPPAETPPKIKNPLAIDSPETKNPNKLAVTSPAYQEGEAIPLRLSGYDQNASVPLEWTKGPDGTKGYAILMEDPDAAVDVLPVPHWLAWNVPAETTSLREGLVKHFRLTDPKGLSQGRNYTRRPGYDGPRPAAGDPPHHYHVQVFALDAALDLPIGATRAEVLAAMKGHVLASGQLVGLFQRPPEPKKP